MYAVIQANDKQYRVEEGQKLIVEKIEGEPESTINFDKVIFLKKGENEYLTGTPHVAGVEVKTSIIKQFKDKKVIVFKKKRRKGYKKKQGHRQNYTLLRVDKIEVK